MAAYGERLRWRGPASSVDKVELTGEAKTFSTALKAAKDAIETRTPEEQRRVEEVAKKIADGTYSVIRRRRCPKRYSKSKALGKGDVNGLEHFLYLKEIIKKEIDIYKELLTLAQQEKDAVRWQNHVHALSVIVEKQQAALADMKKT